MGGLLGRVPLVPGLVALGAVAAVLLLAVLGVLGPRARGSGAPDAHRPTSRPIPPLDARAPVVTETATFALG